jgi:hypothetical protein
MPQAQLTVDLHFAVGTVNRRLFGSFVEHLGRSVYDGIYEPNDPLSDNDGFRTDVLELGCRRSPSPAHSETSRPLQPAATKIATKLCRRVRCGYDSPWTRRQQRQLSALSRAPIPVDNPPRRNQRLGSALTHSHLRSLLVLDGGRELAK